MQEGLLNESLIVSLYYDTRFFIVLIPHYFFSEKRRVFEPLQGAPATQCGTTSATSQDNDSNIQEQEIVQSQSNAGQKRPRNPKYTFTERWDCDHAGHWKDNRNLDLPPEKRRLHRRKDKSIKVDCKAHFWLRQHFGLELVELEYHWEHSGHEPGSLKDFQDSRMPHNTRRWIDKQVEQGMDWRSIQGLLRMDSKSLGEVQSLLLLA